ncbi:hypothetical protein HII31_00317 [Pseudocercospora fuligena]|uniref:Uncharacterized protein n=1 Tax=Pseudocercospora fuligena TaxID=685502 RepID=A0A8H6RXC9_9PEZI|nr:hypothetical protein HII31_00317 [Pseudocercospora fuligena]
MKPSTLLFCATTAQAAVLWWPQSHHAPGQPCGHHGQQHGQISQQVSQTGPFSFRFPFIRHIRIIWPLATRPILPSPAEIANQVFDHIDQQQEDATPPPQAETVQQEEEKEVTILPYTGHLDNEDLPAKAEEIKPEEKVEGDDEEEEAHEDLRRRKQPARKHRVKRQSPGPAN